MASRLSAVCLVAFLFLFHIGIACGEEKSVRQAIEKGMNYVRGTGEKWIQERQCVSCHQIPSLVWSQEAAMAAGIDVPRQPHAELQAWAAEVGNFVKPEQRADLDEEATMSANIDTMTHLLLATPRRDGAMWRTRFAEQLRSQQAEDGSWRACGQLPMQRRPKNETTATTTAWTALALLGEETSFNRDKALQIVQSIEQPISTEYAAVRLLLAARLEDGQAADWKQLLLEHQNEDGGWGWRLEEASNALGTGYAMYALSVAATDPSHLQRGTEYLISTQQEDGGWSVPGTKSSAKGEATETASDWGSAWAVIALSAQRGPAASVAPSSRNSPY